MIDDGDAGTGEYLEPTRVDSIIYLLVSNKMATLKELREDYTIEEAMDMLEIYLISTYNQAQVMKEVK